MKININALTRMLRNLDEKQPSSIYLREIALLMEENDKLKEEVRNLKKENKLLSPDDEWESYET